MYTETIAQAIGVVDVINSQTVTNTSVSSNGIDMREWRRAAFLIQLPSLGAAGTLDGRLQASNTSNFASVTNIPGTNLTQITTASTPNNNALATVEVRGDQLAQLGNNLRYVRLNLTGGGNAITVAAVGLGKDPIQHPGSQYNLNSTFLSQQVVCNQ